LCEACGSAGQQCCLGNSCQTGLDCAGAVGNNRGICTPCGGDGQQCCGGANGTCAAGLGCDNPPGIGMPSTCKAFGAVGAACCGGAVCQMGGICIGSVNGMGGMCQHCGAMGERCCGGVNAPNTCVAGLSCQGQGATQACLTAPAIGGAMQACGPNRTCNG